MEKDVTRIITNPGEEYLRCFRKWQGIPGIEKTETGRLWATWYSGGENEGPYNYVLLVSSDNDGKSWSDPCLVIDPPDRIRAFDPVLWKDDRGRLWLFWNQSIDEWFDGRAGVWRIFCEDPDAPSPAWSKPERIADGIMMNKPIILSTGEWLLPAAVWNRTTFIKEMDNLRKSNVYVSKDGGAGWQYLSGVKVPDSYFDEHMLLELNDGRLWMLVRTGYGIGESFSSDRGKTWSHGKDSGIKGPNSRFHLRRLKSGKILLVNHFNFKGRSHLTASLSENEGQTWNRHLLLDEREDVSYPDAIEDGKGNIYIIYDRERRKDKEILMAVLREEDIVAGEIISTGARLKIPVDSDKL